MRLPQGRMGFFYGVVIGAPFIEMSKLFFALSVFFNVQPFRQFVAGFIQAHFLGGRKKLD